MIHVPALRVPGAAASADAQHVALGQAAVQDDLLRRVGSRRIRDRAGVRVGFRVQRGGFGFSQRAPQFRDLQALRPFAFLDHLQLPRQPFARG